MNTNERIGLVVIAAFLLSLGFTAIAVGSRWDDLVQYLRDGRPMWQNFD